MATDHGLRTAKHIKVAVLGTGSLGREHARIYAELATEVQLAGVFDSLPETARKVAAKHHTRAFDSIAELTRAADAISVVTPTATHFELARMCLQQGKHV